MLFMISKCKYFMALYEVASANGSTTRNEKKIQECIQTVNSSFQEAQGYIKTASLDNAALQYVSLRKYIARCYLFDSKFKFVLGIYSDAIKLILQANKQYFVQEH